MAAVEIVRLAAPGAPCNEIGVAAVAGRRDDDDAERARRCRRQSTWCPSATPNDEPSDMLITSR